MSCGGFPASSLPAYCLIEGDEKPRECECSQKEDEHGHFAAATTAFFVGDKAHACPPSCSHCSIIENTSHIHYFSTHHSHSTRTYPYIFDFGAGFPPRAAFHGQNLDRAGDLPRRRILDPARDLPLFRKAGEELLQRALQWVKKMEYRMNRGLAFVEPPL